MTPIQKARTRLMLRNPFFGTLLLTTPLVETSSIPTAATDMKRIYWNPAFFATLTIDEIVGVLAHEVMHILFLHGFRRGGRHPEKWNYACDYAINWTLQSNGLTLPKRALLDAKYAGMAAERIYTLLPDEPPGGGGGLAGDLMPADVSGPDDQAKVEEDIRGRVAQAATAARLAGNLPADLERIVGALLAPQVDWREMLRRYMTQRARNRMDWSRPNRRFPSLHLPTRRGTQTGEVGIIFDTSGSITDKIIRVVGSEAHAIAADIKAERIRVKYADACTRGEQVFEAGAPLDLKPVGGGGTDMRVPLAEFANQSPLPAVVVLLSDGRTPWPAADPPYPLVVCCTTDAKVPVGDVVRLDV